jgi:hypothetical protein
LTPDEAEALGGIAKRWATMKGWPTDKEIRNALIDCVLRYCTNAFAIRACIAHFAEGQEWVPTEFDIRTAAEEHAWSASDMTRLKVLRREADGCNVCQGSGRAPVKVNRRNVLTGRVHEYTALGWCDCPYGQLRAKVAGSAA